MLKQYQSTGKPTLKYIIPNDPIKVEGCEQYLDSNSPRETNEEEGGD